MLPHNGSFYRELITNKELTRAFFRRAITKKSGGTKSSGHFVYPAGQAGESFWIIRLRCRSSMACRPDALGEGLSHHQEKQGRRKRKRQIQHHISRGIPELCVLGCLWFLHLNGGTNRLVSLCVHIRILEIRFCAFAKVDLIRHHQAIRNDAVPEGEQHCVQQHGSLSKHLFPGGA